MSLLDRARPAHVRLGTDVVAAVVLLGAGTLGAVVHWALTAAS
ncbi:hypothetical protein [Aeromicrobium massiliense]|nr:hypothetical protein [Aeromicrobium massiliense]